MSNSTDPDDRQILQSVASLDNSNSLVASDEYIDDTEGNEAAIRSVVDRVCQAVCEACCSIEVQLCNRLTAIQHDSFEADKKPEQSDEPIVESAAQESVAESAAKEPISSICKEELNLQQKCNLGADLQIADIAEENEIPRHRFSSNGTEVEQASSTDEAPNSTELKRVLAAESPFLETQETEQKATEASISTESQEPTVSESFHTENYTEKSISEDKQLTEPSSSCPHPNVSSKSTVNENVSEKEQHCLGSLQQERVQANELLENQPDFEDQQEIDGQLAIQDTEKPEFQTTEKSPSSPETNEPLQQSLAKDQQQTSGVGSHQVVEGKSSTQAIPFAELLREQYNSSSSNSPDVDVQSSEISQRNVHDQQQSELSHVKLMSEEETVPSISSESEAESHEAVLAVANSPEDEEQEVQRLTATKESSEAEVCQAEAAAEDGACDAKVEAATSLAFDSAESKLSTLKATEPVELDSPCNAEASDRPDNLEAEKDIFDSQQASAQNNDAVWSPDSATETHQIFCDVAELLSDICCQIASEEIIKTTQQVTNSNEDNGEDLMLELRDASTSDNACVDAEVDDYMSELCGDNAVPKTGADALTAENAESDLMTELSGSANQLTTVVVADESGDEAETDSKLILCTGVSTGVVGSGDLELTESTAEPVVAASSAELPSTSTPTLSQTGSSAPAALSVASATADTLASIKAMAVMASANSGSSADELAALKRRLEQLEAENKMLKESIQPASSDPAPATVIAVVSTGSAAAIGPSSGTQQHQQADSSGSPQSFSSYDSSSQNFIPAGGFLKSLSEIEESGASEAASTPASSAAQQPSQSLESGIGASVTAAATVPASTVATASIQAPICSLNAGNSAAANQIPATITASGQIQFILPPGVLPSNFAGLTAVSAVPQSASSVQQAPAVVLPANSMTTKTLTTATGSAAKPTTHATKSSPSNSKSTSASSTTTASSSSASTSSNRRVRTIAPKPIAMRPILPSPKTDMSTKVLPIQLPNSKNSSNSSASGSTATAGVLSSAGSKKSKASSASKKPVSAVPASTVAAAALHGSVPVAMQLPPGAIAAVSQSKSLPLVVGTPIGVCASMAPLLAGAGIPVPVNHSSGAAVWAAAAPPGAAFATTWAPTAPTAVVFSSSHLSAGSLEGTALPSHDLLAIACQEAGLSLDLDLGSTVMISTSQDSSATAAAPIIEGVDSDQQSANVADQGALVVDSQHEPQQESSFLHELGLIQPPMDDNTTKDPAVAMPLSSEPIVQCPPGHEEQKQQQGQEQSVQQHQSQQQQQQQECWNTTTFDAFNDALNDFNSDSIATTTSKAKKPPTGSAVVASKTVAASKPDQMPESTSTAVQSKSTSLNSPGAKKSPSKTKSASESQPPQAPASSSMAATVESPAVATQSSKSALKKKTATKQQETTVAASQSLKRGSTAASGSKKSSASVKDRELKSSKQRAQEPEDDLELFKEIIPQKSVVKKLSENDEIEEAVKGIVGSSSLEDTISGVLKAGEESTETKPAVTSSETRTDSQSSLPPPPPSSSTATAGNIIECQLADLSAAAADTCPVVSIPESVALPFGDPSCLTSAETAARTFDASQNLLSEATKSREEERDGGGGKKKQQQDISKKAPATDQESKDLGASNKRKSVESLPGPSKVKPAVEEKLASPRKDRSASPTKDRKSTKDEKFSKEKGLKDEKFSKDVKSSKDAKSSKVEKFSTCEKSLKDGKSSKSSKDLEASKVDQQKPLSRSALQRSKQTPEDKAGSAAEPGERKQKPAKESPSDSANIKKISESASEKQSKASTKSESTVVAKSSLSHSSPSKKSKKAKSKSKAKEVSKKSALSTEQPVVRRSERSRSSASRSKRDESAESSHRCPPSSVSTTSESASIVGHSGKNVRASSRIAAKNVKRQSSESRSADCGRLSDVDSSSEDTDSESVELDKPTSKSKTPAKKSAVASSTLSTSKVASTAGGNKLSGSGSGGGGLSRQDSDQLLYEHHPMHGEPVTSREKRLSARRARQSELELHEAVEASKITAAAAASSSSSSGKSKTMAPSGGKSSETKTDAKEAEDSSKLASGRDKEPRVEPPPPPLPELKPGDEIAAALEDNSSGVAEGIGLLEEASGSGLRGIGDAAQFLWNRAVLGGVGDPGGCGVGGEDSLASHSNQRRRGPLIEERSPSPPPQPSLALEIIARGGIARPKPSAQQHELPSPLLLSSPLSTRAPTQPQPTPTPPPPAPPPPPPPPPPAPAKPAFIPMNLSKLEKREAASRRAKDGAASSTGTPATPTTPVAAGSAASGSPIKRKFFSSDREDRRRFLFKQNFGSVGAKTGTGGGASAGGGGGSSGSSGAGAGSRGQYDFEPDAGGKRARRNQASEAAATAAAAAALLDLSAQVVPSSVAVPSATTAAEASTAKVPKISIKPVKPDVATGSAAEQPVTGQDALKAAADPQIPIKLKLKLSNQLQQQQLQQQLQQQHHHQEEQQEQQQQQQQLERDTPDEEGKLTAGQRQLQQQQQQQKLLECGSPRPMGYEEDYAQILKQKNKKRDKRQHHKDKQQRKKDRRDKKKKAKSEQHQQQQQQVPVGPGSPQTHVADAETPADYPGRVHPFLTPASAVDDASQSTPGPAETAAHDAGKVGNEEAGNADSSSAELLHRMMAARSGVAPISSQDLDAVFDSKAASAAAAATTSSSASMILPKKRKIYQPGADVSADDYAASAAFSDHQQHHQQQHESMSSKRRHLDEAGSSEAEINPALQSQLPPPQPPPAPLPPPPAQQTQQPHSKKKDDYQHQQYPQQQQQHHHRQQQHPATPGSVTGSLNSPWGGSGGYGGSQAAPSPYGLHMPVVESAKSASVSAPPVPPPPPPPPPPPQPPAALPAPPTPPTFNAYEAAAAAAANTYGNQFLSQYDPYGLNFVYQRAQQYSSDYFGWQANHHAAVAAYGHHFPPVFPPAAAAAAAAATGDAAYHHAQHHQHHQSVVSSASAAAAVAAAAAASTVADLSVGGGSKRQHHQQQHQQQHQHGHQQQSHHQHLQQHQAHQAPIVSQAHQHAQQHQPSHHHHHHHAAAAAAAAASAAANPYRPQDFYSQTSQLFSNFYPPAFDPRRAAAGHHLNPFGGSPFP